MGDAGDEEILEKIDTIHEQLKEKEEQYNRFEAMNQTLIVNEELQGTAKELIKVSNISSIGPKGNQKHSKFWFCLKC